ncbi:flavin-containing monooxygenase [Xanthomonas hortorum]|uniref:Alpha/beta hydrolase fold domain-containing protein n=1 Tax=Xanthomonas hortorum pv. hederae TaxID=453603 RepID=A0A9X3YZ81_9XANT|nr:alpha/beta hydrolase fold domain-containing protein [Xanthomonas hortorum]MCE4369619.1 alpha/beta hydrolase fold domain-containing protein [Xanthomonas hortorum pv. hederae]MDC8637117.1 alpha/beta hydrolase fold domain-containing protein [Xanthomonas hortorum pv. hederae]PPU86165.1 esterase [Xanthomonas hortorum pv. hederae]PUF01229.1 esterase [Xanthomonas hortorum pv. hederae]
MSHEKDVVVIGAGFAGLYAVHKLRDQLGLDVQGIEAAGGVGGTWWWNRYPGCRCDFESVHYSYSFSEELQREWEWSELFASQPEILAYLEWVAERLDLRKAFRFDTRVSSVTWDAPSARWIVRTEDGPTYAARYVVSCVGILSVPKSPEFSGTETFGGELYRTSHWPHQPVDFAGKRVAVIGTGSTGIQVIQEVAKQAAHLTVFQRSPAYAAPLRNAPLTAEQRRWNADHHAELRQGSRHSFMGIPYEGPAGPALAFTPEERRRILDTYYERGGFPLLLSTFSDILFSQEANDVVADYIRERIRERVKDTAKAELLCPTDHPYGTYRPPFETGYFEVYNQSNVDLVDVRQAPIEALTPQGLRTSAASYEFDVIILATGFDALTAPQVALNVTGRDGLTLKDKWAQGPATFLGSQAAGFPNFFMIIGPQSTGASYNAPLAIEDAIDFAAGVIDHARQAKVTTVEPIPEAERRWGELCDGILGLTLLPKAEKAWWLGRNVAGKPRGAYMFFGGAPLYRAYQAEIAAHGHAGFAFDGKAEPLSPLLRLTPVAATVVGALLVGEPKPPETVTLEETRAQMEGLRQLQAPGPQVRVETIDQPRARIYVPDADGPLPVIVYYHGGGFIAGSLDLVDSPARSIAANLGVIVVSAGYRLAPEHPYPAATDDTFAALQWVHETIGEYGGDRDRIVVMGDSAGATLAAVAALRARDAGIDLAGQVLIYPPTDPEATTASRVEFANGPLLSETAIQGMWNAYLAGAEVGPLAAPSRAQSLAGLPPALVVTVELDPVRDEAEDYARALAAAGVPVEQHRFDGLFHSTLTMTAVIPEIQELYARIGRFLEVRITGHVARKSKAVTTAGN